MKLFNVQGESYSGLPTQDIEFNSAPAIELADAKTTREIFDLRMRYGDDPEELQRRLSRRADADLQKARDAIPVTHLESMRLYSQTAYRFGDYVFKYSLSPSTQTQQSLGRETIERNDDRGPDILHRWLHDYLLDHDAEYLFQVQLLENLDEQPVEYAGAEWDEQKYPWQTVATIRIPKQESWDFARKVFWEDHVRVDPWLGLKSYQPLGSANRLRREVYPKSAALRRHINNKQEIHIKSIDEIPN